MLDVIVFLFLIFSIGVIVFLILGVIYIYRKNGKAKKTFSIAGALLMAVIISALAAPSQGSEHASTDVNESQDSAPVKSTYKDETILEKHKDEPEEVIPPVITKEESDQINEGMPYEQVIAIIGEEGVLKNETRMSHSILTSYKWQNNDGSYGYIQFIDKNTGTPNVADFTFTDLK